VPTNQHLFRGEAAQSFGNPGFAMMTDWILIRRAAAELERELRGARVVDAGLLDDGRFALRFSGRRGRGDITLAVDLFGSPPILSLEPDEL
jgi:hypothetical protein